MIGILVAIVIIVGIALLIALYTLLLTSLYPETIRTNEVFFVRTDDLWMLRVCRYRKSRAAGEPVLLVHGMGANQNNFTSPENGCLVDYLRDKGYDCWTVDLRGCRSSQPPFERTRDDVRMEDFFRDDIPSVIAHILKVTNYSKLHWIGHSMGGMLLYAYALDTGGDEIASGVTLGSPIDFSDAAGEVPAWLLAFGEKFPVIAGNLIRGIVPIVKALQLGSCAFPINHKNLPDNITAGHFINMLEDPLPLLMRQVRHWLTMKEYKLADGSLDVTAQMPEFPVPLLAFFAAKDPFINVERAVQWFGNIKNRDKKAVVCSKEHGFAEDYSHCDLAFSKEADKEIFEPILQWLLAHPCPVRSALKEEAERVSAGAISDEKRAKILSGTAYDHVTLSEGSVPETEAPDDSVPDASMLPQPKEKNAQISKPAKKKKTPAKKKTAAAPKKAVTAKKTTVKKKKTAPAAKKASPKAAHKKKSAAQKDKSVKGAAEAEAEEGPNPEALEKANKARAERNSVFSELMASLAKPADSDSDKSNK